LSLLAVQLNLLRRLVRVEHTWKLPFALVHFSEFPVRTFPSSRTPKLLESLLSSSIERFTRRWYERSCERFETR
jgi:hypothetical protein